jgi:hypothetical protein
VNYTKQQMQDLRDQYVEEMNVKAQRTCEMFAAIGCTVVSVDRDGHVTHYNTQGGTDNRP